jgi:hypothetical protein
MLVVNYEITSYKSINDKSIDLNNNSNTAYLIVAITLVY